jgi:hypothetical protein
LEAGPSVASDLLIARIHDVKVSDAMKMLSVVEVGKWSPKNGVTTFSKDGDEVEKRQAAEKAKLVKGWADKIAQFASRMGELLCGSLQRACREAECRRCR